ncbi:hypothetical protein BXZ70DRAFT_950277 [Cristinia sonorae]|uniref:Uncharacterized protein n=1 Tax=Cristinia sonorae TaxID=1940300 RepID=A0A8K0UKJ0_9AGAR|nr:hypothetical protein BXZ70DRAFT_950277 [Cristinia sonorae]
MFLTCYAGNVAKYSSAPLMPSSRLPQELVDAIIDCLALDDDADDPSRTSSLESCALVAETWVPRCLYRLRYTFRIDVKMMAQKIALLDHPSIPSYIRKVILNMNDMEEDRSDLFAAADIAAVLTVTNKITHLKISFPLVESTIPRVSLAPMQFRISPALTHLSISAVGFWDFNAFKEIMACFPQLESLALRSIYQCYFNREGTVVYDTCCPPSLKTLRITGLEEPFSTYFPHWVVRPSGPPSVETFIFNIFEFNSTVEPRYLLENLSHSLRSVHAFVPYGELPSWPPFWELLDEYLTSGELVCLEEVHIQTLDRDAPLVPVEKIRELMPRVAQRKVNITTIGSAAERESWVWW